MARALWEVGGGHIDRSIRSARALSAHHRTFPPELPALITFPCRETPRRSSIVR